VWADMGRPVLSSSFPSVQPRNTSATRGPHKVNDLLLWGEMTSHVNREQEAVWWTCHVQSRCFVDSKTSGLPLGVIQCQTFLNSLRNIALMWCNGDLSVSLTDIWHFAQKRKTTTAEFFWFCQLHDSQRMTGQRTNLIYASTRFFCDLGGSLIPTVFIWENKRALSNTLWFWPPGLALLLRCKTLPEKAALQDKALCSGVRALAKRNLCST